MKRLHGKVAVVTGASRGIGRAIAQRLARDGALVCINYRGNADAAKAAVGDIEAAGGEAFALRADVGSVEQLGRMGQGAQMALPSLHQLLQQETDARVRAATQSAIGAIGRHH